MILSENADVEQYRYEIKFCRKMFEGMQKQKQPFKVLKYYFDLKMDLIREMNIRFPKK